MSSLAATEKECAAVAVAPRVSLADIESAIAVRCDTDGAMATAVCNEVDIKKGIDFAETRSALARFSICILVMRNGFTVIGKSAPASPANYSAQLGRKLAYEDAVRQLWPLMGFALRDKLAGDPNTRAAA